MGKKNFEREYHRNRLARKYVKYRFMGYRDGMEWGLHKDWSEFHNGHGSWWSNKDGLYFRPFHTGPIATLYRRRYRFIGTGKLTLDDISFWEAEKLELERRHTESKMWTDKGSIIGYGKSKKWIRRKYNRERRRNGKAYSHHAMIDNLDYADDRITHEHRPPYWWDIF